MREAKVSAAVKANSRPEPMNETPRTDAQTRISTGQQEWVHVEFARQLEREAAHWQNKCHRAWDECDKLRTRQMMADWEIEPMPKRLDAAPQGDPVSGIASCEKPADSPADAAPYIPAAVAYNWAESIEGHPQSRYGYGTCESGRHYFAPNEGRCKCGEVCGPTAP